MSDKHPVRTSIIGTTVGGILVAVVLAAAGYVEPAWRGVRWVLSGAWNTFTMSVPVPLGVLLLVLAGCVVAIRRRASRAAGRVDTPPALAENAPLRADSTSSPLDPRAASRVLDRLHKRVMIALGSWDADTPTFDELADDLGMSRLKVEQLVEYLQAVGLVTLAEDDSGEPVIDVTRAGRDYLIAKGHA